jgi:mannose-1-phosphate guanylyltransferase
MRKRSSIEALHQQTDHRWGLILAGGDGIRLQNFIRARFGEYRPKQYCALIGKRSMLRHTIDRVSILFQEHHLLTTISAQHCAWAFGDLHDRRPDTVIIQPINRETGPGILLSLLHIHHYDPDAIVAIFPADHFILQEERYRSFISKAMSFVSSHKQNIVALGIAPNTLQFGYGWIEKGEHIFSEEVYSVKKFWEKPDACMTQYLHEKKCLWNTMTLVGTSENFLNVLEEHMNDVFVPAQRIANSIGASFESEVTDDVFKSIPSVNFSRTVLEKIPDRLSVLQMDGIYWNDWGDESRVRLDIDFLEHMDSMISPEKIRPRVE